MRHYICGGNKYQSGEGYIYLPVKITNLPNTITISGDILGIKNEFHVSLVNTKRLAYENIEEKVINYFCDFTSKNEVSFLKYRDEFRLVKRGWELSIIVMCDISNLELFFKEMEKDVGIKADLQPTHVTLYTLKPSTGIGVSSQSELRLTKLIKVSGVVKTALGLE